MEKEQPNRIRPGGAAEWKRFRSLTPAEREQARAQRAAEEQEQTESSAEEMKRAYVFKLLALLVLAGALVTFTTIAWFTMNKETGSSGMGVKVASDLFTIEAVNASGYHVGIYDDSAASGTYVRDVLLNRSGKSTDTITWTITDDIEVTDASGTKSITKGKNIGNGPAEGYEGGINPGSSGEIQFIVKPNRPVDAAFSFYVYAFTGGYDEHGDLDKSTIQLVTSGADADTLIAQRLLNGHILLFSEKDNNGQYSGLIASDSDFIRLMEKSYSAQTTVSIYWVWPETLAEIILDENTSSHTRNLRGKKNICNASGQAEVIAFFKSDPSWFLLNPENGNHDWSAAFNQNASNADVVNTINTNYAVYSSYYNEADQCIGTYISYIMLSMSAEGSESAGSGS